MDKRAWAVWTEGQSDPEYRKLYQQMYDLEAKFEESVSQLDIPVQEIGRAHV